MASGEGASSSAPSQAGMSGKFVDLPGAEMGKVVTRFPPEASGCVAQCGCRVCGCRVGVCEWAWVCVCEFACICVCVGVKHLTQIENNMFVIGIDIVNMFDCL